MPVWVVSVWVVSMRIVPVRAVSVFGLQCVVEYRFVAVALDKLCSRIRLGQSRRPSTTTAPAHKGLPRALRRAAIKHCIWIHERRALDGRAGGRVGFAPHEPQHEKQRGATDAWHCQGEQLRPVPATVEKAEKRATSLVPWVPQLPQSREAARCRGELLDGTPLCSASPTLRWENSGAR